MINNHPGELPFIFKRNLYRDVIDFKREHPGVLEELTRQRKERERRAHDDYQRE